MANPMAKPVSSPTRRRQELLAHTPERLRGQVDWAKSEAVADFVTRTLESADEDGQVLWPGSLAGFSIYVQMLIVGWLTSPDGHHKPMRFCITPAGRAALGDQP